MELRSGMSKASRKGTERFEDRLDSIGSEPIILLALRPLRLVMS